MKLNELQNGQSGIIIQNIHSNPMKQRLFDLGLTTGSIIQCGYRSPYGDPVAYYIHGTIIALRKEDCEKIFVEDLP